MSMLSCLGLEHVGKSFTNLVNNSGDSVLAGRIDSVVSTCLTFVLYQLVMYRYTWTW